MALAASPVSLASRSEIGVMKTRIGSRLPHPLLYGGNALSHCAVCRRTGPAGRRRHREPITFGIRTVLHHRFAGNGGERVSYHWIPVSRATAQNKIFRRYECGTEATDACKGWPPRLPPLS